MHDFADEPTVIIPRETMAELMRQRDCDDLGALPRSEGPSTLAETQEMEAVR